MNHMKAIIVILIWVIFLTGCSGTHPFIMSVTAQPGYPGEQHDLFPCAAFRMAAPVAVDSIAWDTNLGAWQNINISTTYLPGQFSGLTMSGNQRNGWSIDDAGYAYFSHVTLTNTIEVYQSAIGPYLLGAWALWAADATQTWENIDFSGFDDYIFGMAYDSVGPNLYGMWLDTNTPPLIFATAPDFATDTPLNYSCTRFGDSLYGPLHYIWDGTLGTNYNFIGPPSAGVLPGLLIAFVPLQPPIVPFTSCQIVGDFEERLWTFFYDPILTQISSQIAFSSLTATAWEYIAPVPFTTPDATAWKVSTRRTDDTIHTVSIYAVPDGADWDYQIWYTRRSKWGWLDPVMIDNWPVIALVKHLQDERLSAQITTSPSGVMLWTIQYDSVLGIGDVYAYYLDPAVYHDPTTGPWITYPDADGTNFDYLELNAPKWWPI